VAGFEPAASSSQTRRDNRATLHPDDVLRVQRYTYFIEYKLFLLKLSENFRFVPYDIFLLGLFEDEIMQRF
jgi:hypothetical protein